MRTRGTYAALFLVHHYTQPVFRGRITGPPSLRRQSPQFPGVRLSGWPVGEPQRFKTASKPSCNEFKTGKALARSGIPAGGRVWEVRAKLKARHRVRPPSPGIGTPARRARLQPAACTAAPSPPSPARCGAWPPRRTSLVAPAPASSALRVRAAVSAPLHACLCVLPCLGLTANPQTCEVRHQNSAFAVTKPQSHRSHLFDQRNDRNLPPPPRLSDLPLPY